MSVLDPRRMASWAVIVSVLLIAGLGLVLLMDTFAGAKTAEVSARLQAGRADAAIATAGDVADTVAGTAAAERVIDSVTEANAAEIRAAPGATATIDPSLHAVGLRALCRRPTYRRATMCAPFAAGPE